MEVTTSELLKDRGGHTRGNYSCPVYISVEACKALFGEAGVEPAPKAVGVLGDILENFAMSLIGEFKRASNVRQAACAKAAGCRWTVDMVVSFR